MSDEASARQHSAIDVRLRRLGMSEKAIVDWWGTPNSWLDGEVPEEALARGEYVELVRAARGMFQLEVSEWTDLGQRVEGGTVHRPRREAADPSTADH